MNYYINDYEICLDTHEFLKNGCPQKIEPQVFKLLLFMLENPDRVITRNELVSRVWKTSVISDSALNATISAARYAIGDSGSKQQCIKTISGCGYRFIASFTCKEKVRALAKSQFSLALTDQKKAQTTDEKLIEPLEIPDKPSVAMMNFIDTSAKENGCLLAYGLTVEINAALSRCSHFFVIARASAASVSKRNLTPKEISQCLGVRYLVYGNTLLV